MATYTVNIGSNYTLSGSWNGQDGAYVENGGIAGNHDEAYNSGGYAGASAGTLFQSRTGSWAEIFHVIDVKSGAGQSKGDLRVQLGGFYEGGMTAIIGSATVIITGFLYNVSLNKPATPPTEIFRKNIQYAGQQSFSVNFSNKNILTTVYNNYRYRVGYRIEAIASSTGSAYAVSDFYEPLATQLPIKGSPPGYLDGNNLNLSWPAV
jgi:hypothetical protein